MNGIWKLFWVAVVLLLLGAVVPGVVAQEQNPLPSPPPPAGEGEGVPNTVQVELDGGWLAVVAVLSLLLNVALIAVVGYLARLLARSMAGLEVSYPAETQKILDALVDKAGEHRRELLGFAERIAAATSWRGDDRAVALLRQWLGSEAVPPDGGGAKDVPVPPETDPLRAVG